MKTPVLLAIGCLFLASGTGLMAETKEKSVEKGEAQKKVVTVVTADEAKKLLAEKEAPVVIDIRTAEEFKEGHIKGAKQIDFQSESFRAELAKLDPKKSYLFHCRSGGRSTKSLPVWKELGFQKLYHLDSGMLGWEKANGETVKDE